MKRFAFIVTMFFVFLGMYSQDEEIIAKSNLKRINWSELSGGVHKFLWMVDGYVLATDDNGDVSPVKDAVVYIESVSDSITNKKGSTVEDGKFHLEMFSKKEMSDYRMKVKIMAKGFVPFYDIFEATLDDKSQNFDFQKVDTGVILLKRKEN